MHQLDQTDKDILKILQADAEYGSKQIAHDLNRAVATIHDRIRKLKEEGYIKKTVMLVDRKLIGTKVISLCHIILSNHSFDAVTEFEREVIKFPEVMECLQITGAYDFVLRIAATDIDSYQEFYRNKLTKLPNVGSLQSCIVLSETKNETAYPL